MSKTRRMNRIFAADGRSVSLALDGFGFSEKTAGVDVAARKVPAMVEHGLDNVLVTYGQARNFAEHFAGVGLTLRVDTTTAVYDGSVPDTMPAFQQATWPIAHSGFCASSSVTRSPRARPSARSVFAKRFAWRRMSAKV